MAIVHFGEQAPADAANVRWVEDKSWKAGGYYTWQTHVGVCLHEREMNGYDDSDFYMLVWDESKGAPVEILFASTRGWSYPSYASRADATPEVRAKYEAWAAERAAEARAAAIAAEAAAPRKGKTVRLVRTTRGKQGRPAGTVGKVFWIQETVNRYGFREARIGVDAGGDRFFTDGKNVEVVRD